VLRFYVLTIESGGEIMPNIKSAIKRVSTNKTKHAQNRVKKSDLKTTLRSFREAVDVKAPNSLEIMKDALSKVDKAAAKNLIHKNAASRKKSQLMKAYNAMTTK
jgi:small subunit ribosomal protein S20